MKKEVIREHGGKDVHKPVQPISRKPASKFGKFLASATIVSSLLLGNGAKAEEKKTVKVANASSIQNTDKANKKESDLERLNRLDGETQKYMVVPPHFNKKANFFTAVSVPIQDGESDRLLVTVSMCRIKGCAGDTMDKSLGIEKNGEAVALIDLAELDKLYEIATGKRLEYVKIIVDKFQSKKTEYGTGIVLQVVPTQTLNGSIKENIPYLLTIYYAGVGQVTEEKTKLVALK